MDALVLRRICQPPITPIGSAKNWPHLNGLQLADPHYYEANPLDILIGADLYGQLLIPEIRKGRPGSPVAQNTHLGWIISGPTHIVTPPSYHAVVRSISIDDRIDECLERFWAIEECEQRRHRTIDEDKCEANFLSSFFLCSISI